MMKLLVSATVAWQSHTTTQDGSTNLWLNTNVKCTIFKMICRKISCCMPCHLCYCIVQKRTQTHKYEGQKLIRALCY
jgi:hypothetical protein